MKYIITEGFTGLEMVYIFPPWVEHKYFADKLNERIVSAGLIKFNSYDGNYSFDISHGSHSLDIDFSLLQQKKDLSLIKRQITFQI